MVVGRGQAPEGRTFWAVFLLCGLLIAQFPPGTFGQDRTADQAVCDAIGGSGEKQDLCLLEKGRSVRRKIAGGEQHPYRVRLGAGQLARVVVEQDGIDLALLVSGPDGKVIAEVDFDSRLRAQESISQVAEAAGDYQFIVRSRQKMAPAGHYEIRIEELRAATEDEHALQAARVLYQEYLKLRRAGKYDEALPLAQRALEIREQKLGPDDRDVAVTIDSLAGLYWYKGQYAKAEPLCLRALATWERTLGPEHPRVAASFNNLAELYWSKGEYEKAEPFHLRALAIWERALGPEHPDVAVSLDNLGNIYRDSGEYEKAEPLYQRALEIREQVLGPDHLYVSESLNDLGLFYQESGQYERPEPLYRRALAIREKSLGAEHPYVADTLNNLASFYQDLGAYDRAEPLYRRALAIREKVLGPDHPSVAVTLNNLAVLHTAKGRLARALELQARANAVTERNLALNLATGSERQRLAYLATLTKQADRTISLHLRSAPGSAAAGRLAAAIILQQKGRALDATSEKINALRRRFNPEDQVLLDRLNETRTQIAGLVLRGPLSMTGEQYRERIKTLEALAENYEAEISRRSSEFRAESLPLTLAAVRAAIPADAALIEFSTYRPFNAKAVKDEEAYGPPHYVAYILRRRGRIQWKELGAVEAIDRTLLDLRRALRSPKRGDVKLQARAVDRKVFQPLRPLIGDAGKLLISPEGELNLIPFAALIDGQGRYLVERYSISYLDSGRDLLRLQVPRDNRSGPLVMAAPDFGGAPQAEVERLLTQKTDESGSPAKSDSPIYQHLYFPSLPYAAEEGEALRALLPGATLFTKREASKAALSQVLSPRILHIATHGFFLQDLDLPPTGDRGYRGVDEEAGRLLRQLDRGGARIESPLLRSGLALAGANEQRPAGEDNGILTALEVSGLNLWGTKLAVFSACDTGVGEVKKGDGVHGLRRSLVLAGAETQVMSLWPVSDQGTRELMVAYYAGLQRGLGRGEALRRVQLEMLKQGKRQHPYYWASFIQSGEWANLDGQR